MLTTLTTLGASLFPFYGLLSSMVYLWRDPLQFLRAPAILRRPGAAKVLDKHVRFSAKEEDVSRVFRAHAHALWEDGTVPKPKGSAATWPLLRLLYPDPLYPLYAMEQRRSAEAVVGALEKMRDGNLLQPLGGAGNEPE